MTDKTTYRAYIPGKPHAGLVPLPAERIVFTDGSMDDDEVRALTTFELDLTEHATDNR